MEDTTRCAVVTGGNRGLGFAICKLLASNGILVILTARDEKGGNEAVKNIKESGYDSVVFHRLDISDPNSVASLASFIQTQYGKLDILVNNAGVIGIVVDTEVLKAKGEGVDLLKAWENPDENKGLWKEPYNLAEETVKINFYGTKRTTEALLPLLELSNSPRVVNISSTYGLLSVLHNDKVNAQLRDIERLSEADLDELLQQFLKDFKENKVVTNGWPRTLSAVKTTHIMINAYTRILAKKFPNILINSVHPGYMITDMTNNTGELTPEEAAKAPVKLAMLPNDGPTGSFFDEMELGSFDEISGHYYA